MVEEREAVAEGAAAFFADEFESSVGDFDVFFLTNLLEVWKHDSRRGEAEGEDLASGGDGDGDFFEVGGGEDEDDVGGGFFQSFEKGVEGGFREHVNFVDDVDLEFAFRWGDDGFFAEVADVVNAGVRGSVDFDDVEVRVFELIFEAVDFVGQDASDGCFAAAAGAGEEVGVAGFSRFEGGFEGFYDLVLADDFGESFWTVFTVEG